MRAKLFLIFLITVLIPAHAFAVTRAGTSIEAQTMLSYGERTITAESLFTVVSQIYGVEITPTMCAASVPGGEKVNLPLRIVNIGNGSARFLFSSYGSPEGWSTALFIDDDRDQIRNLGENTRVPTSVILAEDADYLFFAEVDAPDDAFIGDHGAGIVVCSTEVADGPVYFGANGDLYGGEDTVKGTCDVSIESLGNFRIWRNDKNRDIFLTWGGGYADVFYRTSFGLTFEGAPKEAVNVLSPFTSEAIKAQSGICRYYKIAQTGTTSLSAVILGKFDTDVPVGINQLSLPLIPYDTSLVSIVGTQVKGASNASDADRVWKYNPIAPSYYDNAWLVADVGPGNDGLWYTNNSPTKISIEADQGFIVQIREGHPATYLTFVGSVSAVSRSFEVHSNMTFFGTCFPVEVRLNDSNLWQSGATGAGNASDADRIWKYNPAAPSYYDYAWLVDYTGTPFDGTWVTNTRPTTVKFMPGRGYWFQRRSGRPIFQWNYLRPY